MKTIGSVCIISSCAAMGLQACVEHGRMVNTVRSFMRILSYMESELQYRLTPLPVLCSQAGAMGRGEAYRIMEELSEALSTQLMPDPASCMNSVMATHRGMDHEIRGLFYELGHDLGYFDLPGQLSAIENLRNICDEKLKSLCEGQKERIKSYRLLGMCAGVALAIILL